MGLEIRSSPELLNHRVLVAGRAQGCRVVEEAEPPGGEHCTWMPGPAFECSN